jgi:cytochrome c oxidase subunit 2
MSRWQSVFHPAGPLANRTAHLLLFATIVATIVYALTLLAAYRAAKRPLGLTGPAPLDPQLNQRLERSVTIGVIATVVTLMVFFLYDLSVGRTLSPIPKKEPLTIRVEGHQWWWSATYSDTGSHGQFSVANEIHIPVGEPVLLQLTAQDVIHSIWVPNLGGKKDLIPGYTQTAWFQADTAGTYRGQCAEFCGLEHAKMAMFVVAEPPDKFAEWVHHQQESAEVPTDSLPDRGRDLFMKGTCVMCHMISGTEAGSQVGPDLTHVASRTMLAAGSIPNTAETLHRWIRDPQAIKPGTRMPASEISENDLNAIVAYVRTLK